LERKAFLAVAGENGNLVKGKDEIRVRKSYDPCGAFSIRRPTPQPGPKEASPRLCIAAPFLAWGKIKLSGDCHRQHRLIWLFLHQEVRYERGLAVSQKSKQARTREMIRQLRSLGYRIEPPNPHHPNSRKGSDFRT
jgi:hypothetical protein